MSRGAALLIERGGAVALSADGRHPLHSQWLVWHHDPAARSKAGAAGERLGRGGGGGAGGGAGAGEKTGSRLTAPRRGGPQSACAFFSRRAPPPPRPHIPAPSP